MHRRVGLEAAQYLAFSTTCTLTAGFSQEMLINQNSSGFGVVAKPLIILELEPNRSNSSMDLQQRDLRLLGH